MIFLLFIFACEEDEYAVDFDEQQIQYSIKEDKIVIKNNSPYPIVLDDVMQNEKIVANYIKYKNCNYMKYQEEVMLDLTGQDNQYILIESVVLPKKEKVISINAKKGDRFEVSLYPVNYNFLSDNIYFKSEELSDKESRYKLFSSNEVKDLTIPFVKKKDPETVNEINGIMIYVSEYEDMIDFLEEIEFEYE